MHEAPLPWLQHAKIARRAPLSEEIYGELRKLIIGGDVAPGRAIQEPLVAAHFGVSRTPVREALLRLRNDGLVIIKKQAGTFVSPIDPRSVEEGMLVRDALEPRVAEIAAAQLTGRQIAALEREVFTMKTAAKDDEQRAFIAADDSFHKILIEAGGFPHIAEIIGRVNAQLDRVRYLSVTNRKRARQAIGEHEALVGALREKDGPRSKDLLKVHLSGAWVNIRDILSNLPKSSEAK